MPAVLKAPKINKNMPKQIQISSVPEYDNILILTNPRIRSQIETSPVCVKTHFSFSSPPIERSIETCPEIFKPGANVPNTLQNMYISALFALLKQEYVLLPSKSASHHTIKKCETFYVLRKQIFHQNESSNFSGFLLFS